MSHFPGKTSEQEKDEFILYGRKFIVACEKTDKMPHPPFGCWFLIKTPGPDLVVCEIKGRTDN